MHNSHIAETKAIGFGSPLVLGGRTADFGGFFASVRMIHSMGERAGGRKSRLIPRTQVFQPARLAHPFGSGEAGLLNLFLESIMTNLSIGALAHTYTFHNTTLSIVDNHGQPWLRAQDIGQALGYTDQKSIHRIYKRNSSEFTNTMTGVVNLTTPSGSQETRIFSLRGAHLLGMFARTPIAAEFRRWVLDILEREPTQIPCPTPMAIANARKQLTEAVWKKGGIKVDWSQIMPDSEAALGLIGSVLMSSQWLVRFDCATMVPQLYPVPDKALMLTPDQLNERFTELNFTDEQTRALLNKCVDRLYRYKELVDQAQKDITYLVQQKSKLKRN